MKSTTLLFASALLLSGCSDTALRIATPASPEQEVTPELGSGADATGGPGDSNGSEDGGPRGAWDGLDPGNLPDEYFAVAWRPEPCDDCWDPESGVETGHRVDIVDLEGRVIVAFDRPVLDPGMMFESFEAAADGSLLVVETSRQDTYYYQSSEWQRRVWRADVMTGESEELLRLTWGGVELPKSGRSFEAPLHEVRFAPDPTQPDVLWMVSGGDINTDLTLIRVDLVDPDAEPVFHVLAGLPELFGVEDSQYWASTPTSVTVQQVGQEIEVLISIEGSMIYADPMELPRGVVSYRPRDGRLESVLNLRRRTYLADVRFGARGETRIAEGAALLQVGPPRAWCSESQFALVEPGRFAEAGDGGAWDNVPEVLEGVTPIHGDETMGCVRLGPLLDEAGPTFLYWGDRDANLYAYTQAPSRIALSHRGEDVWSWERLRVGLQETEFRMLGIERVLQ